MIDILYSLIRCENNKNKAIEQVLICIERVILLPEALSPHTTQNSTSCGRLKSPVCPNNLSTDSGSVTICQDQTNTGHRSVFFFCITMSPVLLKICQKIINMKAQLIVNGWSEKQCGKNLYPSRYQAVSSSEDKLLGVVCVRRGQEDLSRPCAVSCGQNELLLGSGRLLHCCHYLDLLTRLLVSYNLRV